MKQTPLYEKHLALGAQMTDFGGWQLPVRYTDIIEEHNAVRSAAGLFDVSHMGEIFVQGPGAEAFLQRLLTNDVSHAAEGQCVYSPMCYEDGGTVDDLLIYKLGAQRFLAVVNAANTEKDFAWFRQNLTPGAEAENVSSSYAQLALQGPRAPQILARLTDAPLHELRYYHFMQNVTVAGVTMLVSRTGYTGEDGFEFYLAPEKAGQVWDALLQAGKTDGLCPAGLGARDTLRFEAAMPLYGHELSPAVSPLQAGLGRFVRPEKGPFLGREALEAQQNNGLPSVLVGLELVERGIVRAGCTVQAQGEEAGAVTSGSFSPTLRRSLGLALLKPQLSKPGTGVEVIIRGKPVGARVVPLPFYKRGGAKKA